MKYERKILEQHRKQRLPDEISHHVEILFSNLKETVLLLKLNLLQDGKTGIFTDSKRFFPQH
ncbi:MAG: hypothetical protein ACXWMO_07225, partial [Syntrophales bacterium]